MYSYDIDLSYDEEEIVATLMGEYGDDILEMTDAVYDGIKVK